MHKRIQALVIAGLLSANTLTPLADTLVDVNTGIETKVSSYIKAEKGHLYLSDIDYESESAAGWGEIKKDNAVEGGAIKLIVDGEFVEFGKGMAAHAPSTLVYNISDYNDTYARLMAYLGVDATRGSNGNGVYFIISTSQDGITWNEVHRTGVLKGDMESEKIDIQLNGANYIKLYAHNNGNNSADHSVYGDLKLVKENYNPTDVEIEGLQSIESYDTELRAHDIGYNIQHNEMTILRRSFVSNIGYGTLKRLVAQDQKYADAVTYLLNNHTALSYYVNGGPVNMHGSYLQSLKSFCDIYDKYKDAIKDSSDNNFNLRLAISIALAYANPNPVSSWLKSDKGVNPVHRYEVYQHLVASGKMDEGGGQTNNSRQWSTAEFKALPIPMMRWAVDVRLSDDEILWMVDYALDQKAKGKNYLDAYSYIEYIMDHNFNNPKYYDEENREHFNEKYNFENYYSDYGNTGANRMWMVFEEGAVCGGLTQTYAILSDIFGRPSSPSGQPGHAAAVTYEWNTQNQRYEWTIQNDISGWAESGNQFDDRMLGWGDDWQNSWSIWTNASYTVLASDAVLDWENYVKANLLVLLADSYADNDDKIECYKKALEHQNINLDAWERIIECYRNDDSITSEQAFELSKGIIEAYAFYPQAMVELLNYLSPKVTDGGHIAALDVLKTNTLSTAKTATKDQSTCVSMTRQMANWYLRDNTNSELATFSFDGENAKKIVINPKYEGSQIRVRYSLDGGTTWTETDDHIITLTEDELAYITAENDIKVGLVGTSEVHDIDILAGNTITSSTIYANDNENLLLGATDNLEFSLDGGTTWCDYVTNEVTRSNPNNVDGIRIEGDQTVKVRYKAYGVYLQSNEYEYTFTENTDTEDRKYVQLKNVSLVDFTSEHNSSRAAKYFIDGNPNTIWHTTYNVAAENKFYTVKLDKARNITSLEYLPPGSSNGRLKSGEIYTSLDGENWTLSGRFENLANDPTMKVLNLDEPTTCEYIKLVATNTHGNNPGERDMYFAGRMLNFYEADVNHDDQITTLPDDVPVQDVVPEEDNIDTDMNVKPEPENPDNDFDSDMNVKPELEVPDNDFDTDMNVKPEPENPDSDFDSDMEVTPEDSPTTLPDDIPVGEVGVEFEGGTGGSANTAATLKVNTLEALEHVLKAIINSGEKMSLSRLGEVEVIDQNIVMYKLHVLDGAYGYYVDIKVDTSKTELTDLLNKIPQTSNDATPEEPSNPDTPVVPEQPDADVPDTEQPPVEDDEEEITPPVDGENPNEELPEEDGDTEETPDDENNVDTETPDTEQPSVDDNNNSGEDVKTQPSTEEGTSDNGSETVVDTNSTTASKPSVNNVNTGDTTTVGGYLLLGAISVLGALGIMKKRNKK